MKSFLTWFSKPVKKPEIYAVCSAFTGYKFIKVVVYEKPKNELTVVGPFRSEVDCDEFCQQSNTAQISRFSVKK